MRTDSYNSHSDYGGAEEGSTNSEKMTKGKLRIVERDNKGSREGGNRGVMSTN